jgi:predicted RNA binding protein YcfA (HicA-like mRNA interferase family)
MKRIAPMTVRKLKKGLKRVGKCEPLRQGGNHEIWQSPSGSRIIIPRHPGDLATGTLRKILQQAGIDMSPSEFQAAV